MSDREDLEERLFDMELAEVEGQTPDDELAARVLARLDEPAAEGLAVPARSGSRWLLAAAALAICVVTALAVWARGDAGGGDEATVGGDAQDPQQRSPVQWIEALKDPAQRREAVRALARGGAPAVRAMVAALGDDKAARAHVLEALNVMGPVAAPALPVVTRMVSEVDRSDPLLGWVVKAAATMAPYGDPAQRNAIERAVLFLAFVQGGPAAGPGAGNGPQAGVGAGPPRYSMNDVGRLVHRLAVPADAKTEDLVDVLQDGSPYMRERAAEMLREHANEAARRALYQALLAEHPHNIEVKWRLKEGFSGSFRFAEEYDGMIRLRAARSLVHIAAGQPIAARAHAQLLEVGSLETQRTAARALARIEVADEDRERVEAVVVAAMARDDAKLLCELAIAAGRFAALSDEARSELERLAKHDDRKVAACASAALRMHR